MFPFPVSDAIRKSNNRHLRIVSTVTTQSTIGYLFTHWTVKSREVLGYCTLEMSDIYKIRKILVEGVINLISKLWVF